MKKGVVKVVLFFIFAIVFSTSGYLLIRYGKHNSKDLVVNYSENGSIDYKVFLKDNEFFEEKYLEKNKTYIASLIDYLALDFEYKADFEAPVSGDYTYYFKGIINANKSNNESGNYFTKEVKLTDEKKVEYNNKKEVVLKDSLNVIYDKYNDLLSEFKKKYAISMDGELIISLEVVNHITNDSLGRVIEKKVSMPLSVPLTSQTIEVPIKSNSLKKKSLLYSDTIFSKDRKYIMAKAFGYASFGLSAIFIAFLVKYGVLKAKVVSEYNKKLKKILKVYDGILVNVEKAPELSNFNAIVVKSFEELVDAHSEVRKPINFSEDKDGATFTLLNEGNAWTYKLVKEDIF